jgi:hypothetical protein
MKIFFLYIIISLFFKNKKKNFLFKIFQFILLLHSPLKSS